MFQFLDAFDSSLYCFYLPFWIIARADVFISFWGFSLGFEPGGGGGSGGAFAA